MKTSSGMLMILMAGCLLFNGNFFAMGHVFEILGKSFGAVFFVSVCGVILLLGGLILISPKQAEAANEGDLVDGAWYKTLSQYHFGSGRGDAGAETLARGEYDVIAVVKRCDDKHYYSSLPFQIHLKREGMPLPSQFKVVCMVRKKNSEHVELLPV